MTRFAFFLPLLTIALSIVSCSKPEPTPTTADMVAQTWQMSELSLKTDTKQYTVPPSTGREAVMTFAPNGVYTYYDGATKKMQTGKWTLSNGDKTLTAVNADGTTLVFAVNALTKTVIELETAVADMTNRNPTPQEQTNMQMLGALLLSLDKQYGGTMDMSKEPTPRTLQLFMKGKAQ